MSLTALAWLAVYAGGAVLAFRAPIYGLLAYLFEYYTHPAKYWWGKGLPGLRWSLLIAVVFLVAYLVQGGRLHDPAILRHRQTKWLLAFLAVTVLVTPFAVSVDRSLEYVVDLTKLTLLYFLIVGTVRTAGDFRWCVLAMILGGFLWGVDAYLDPARRGGRLRNIGGPDSLNDNSAAAHLLTSVPFIGIYFLKGSTWERAICFVAAPFILNTIILTNSRGAMVALGVAAVAMLTLAERPLRLTLMGLMLLGAVLFGALMDDTFLRRQVTIAEYEEDGSATGRLESWKGALRLISDYPLGTGGRGFDVLSPIYIPEIVERHGGMERAVHNTYLSVASDWGVLGLFCFLAFIGTTLWQLHEIRRDTRDPRTRLESLGLEVALIGFLTAAVFLNRTYAEILYWLAALTAALRNIQLAERASAEVPAGLAPTSVR